MLPWFFYVELETRHKELEHKSKKQQKELERKSKETEQKQRNFLEDKSTYITPKKRERMLGELECCICQDLMAMTHSLRCGHTFCGLCILQVSLLILHPSFAMQLLVNFLVIAIMLSQGDMNHPLAKATGRLPHLLLGLLSGVRLSDRVSFRIYPLGWP